MTARIQLNEAYASWVSSRDYDLLLNLNTEAEMNYEQMSKLLCRFFYKAECDVFGKTTGGEYRRNLYHSKEKFHIKRVVAIEGDDKRTHAHVKVKTLEGWTNEQMLELLRLTYRHVTKADKDKAFLFEATQINSSDAVSRYITKDTQRQNEKLNDVIDLRSSFISKHSKEQ